MNSAELGPNLELSSSKAPKFPNTTHFLNP